MRFRKVTSFGAVMETSGEDFNLFSRLERHEVLRARGYSFVLEPCGGIVIDRWGHVRGIWRHKASRYAWTPASHTEPTHWAADAEAAVRYTLVVITAVMSGEP